MIPWLVQRENQVRHNVIARFVLWCYFEVLRVSIGQDRGMRRIQLKQLSPYSSKKITTQAFVT
jgi:hypothetical protein